MNVIFSQSLQLTHCILRQVSTKQLARFLNVKTIQPCKPEVADRHSGYQVGGTSPFGTKKTMPIYMEESILQLERIYINGGKRGYLLGMSPQDVQSILHPTLVHVGVVG
jgi:Cys-tRNA(Pro) deacylase